MPIPVISVAQMRQWEKATWASGKTEDEVISRVGEIVKRRALELTRPGDLILILAGKGHNGDDARQAHQQLAGRRAELLNITDPAATMLGLMAALARRPALIIDGIFGIGMNRMLDANWIKLIDRINEARLPVLSIDVPSGLNAETGMPEGKAIQASITLTLGAPKNLMLAPTAWPYVGRLEVAPEIGLVKNPLTGELLWILPNDFDGYPPARPPAAHKGDFGRLGIIAGSLGYHGAAVLAARGAQRAQPGLITLYPQENVYGVIAPQLQAVMVSPWTAHVEFPGPHDGLLIGPGLAGETVPQELRRGIPEFWRNSETPIVVDASALDWLPNASFPRDAIRVITPHPGEAARLLRTSARQVQASRVDALREVSRRMGNCWVVLKGHQTLIGRSAGAIYVNSSGNPRLAQGGSGDVLAGYLAGLLTQPALQTDPLKTICFGVWQHGAAADRLSAKRRNWVVEELVEEIGL
jgi:NAD(P)H-hydrate epimerase